nr:MAG TPA: hypothetical protein [Caudoviricetes sp.]
MQSKSNLTTKSLTGQPRRGIMEGERPKRLK